ncbi:MAG: hypothetical protein ABI779_24015 [Acidobacteriota bacterium]
MYVIVWRFTTSDPVAFERHYGPHGTWTALFERSGDYLRTDLLRGEDGYLTLDWWTSAEAYDAFRREHADAYAEIDRACEALTSSEEMMGSYLPVD